MMKICIIGADFAALEARMMALAAKQNLDLIVVCEDDVLNHMDIDGAILTERINTNSFVEIYGGPAQKRLTVHLNLQHDLHAIEVMSSIKREPHWVTRNNKGRKY